MKTTSLMVLCVLATGAAFAVPMGDESGPPADKLSSQGPPRGAVPLSCEAPVVLGLQSAPIDGPESLRAVTLNTAKFDLSDESRLTVKMDGWVAQHARTAYWIHAAVFDAQGRLLGVAAHREGVEHISVGAIVSMRRQFELDFGVSGRFAGAAHLVVAVSEPWTGKRASETRD